MSEPKEELKIKDLLIKLQVLTNGLIEERKKSQSYLDRIKEYEVSIQNKDSEIVELTKEKFDLKSKLTLEKSKQAPVKKNESYFSSLFNKLIEKPVDDSKVTKLEQKINQQKFEIRDLTQRLMEEKESFDQQKIKFQTMITLQNQEMAKLKQNLQNTQREGPRTEDNSVHQEVIDSLKRQFNIERDEYEKKLAEIKNELKEEKDRNEELTNNLNQIKLQLDGKSSENTAMKKQISKLDSELNKAKIEIHNKQLSPRMFQVERIKDGIVKTKKVMTITFQWNKSQNRIEVVFKRMKHGGKVKEDIVNIIDITSFQAKKKKNEYIDVEFTVSFIYLII